MTAEARGIGSQELELQMVVSKLNWVMGTRPGSSVEKPELLTAESSLQPLRGYFFFLNEHLIISLILLLFKT